MKKFHLSLIVVVLLFLFEGTANSQILEAPYQRSSKGSTVSTSKEPIAVHIDVDGYRYEKEPISYELLLDKLKPIIDSRDPDERTVYVTADNGVPFQRIVELLKVGRKLQFDDFSFLDIPVKIVLDEPMDDEKPGPLFLRVARSDGGSLTLNGKPRTEASLITSLKSTFESRKRRKVYVYGSRDIEKSVFIKMTLSSQYDEFAKLLKLVHSSGADPIAIEIDDVKE